MNVRANLRGKINLLFCCFVLTTHAELTWEATTLARTVHPLQVEDRMTFRFTNTGTNAVEILSAKSTCGCLTPSMSTNRFEAGESGAVNVVFNLRDKTGPQRKGVAVRSSDNPKTPAFLYVETNIRDVYVLPAKRMDWSLSGDRTPQVCHLVNQQKEPVRLVSVSASSGAFDVKLIPIRDGFEYGVQVFPPASSTVERSVITIQTECPPELDESRAYTITVVLR